ncbi:MAG TPA: metalloregulator ArsR/SmtB family transcription factor [Steroidobacteraceae bacterium]|nr:metalloregulator ArsR/SmtB family transcription factor [Steroidobacteraceae bacterium]
MIERQSRLTDAVPVFAALGDATRLKIVNRLCGSGPMSIIELTEGSQVTRQAVSKHLRALERAGLVSSGRVGRERIWELRTAPLAEVRAELEAISDRWDQAIGRLRALVQDNP